MDQQVYTNRETVFGGTYSQQERTESLQSEADIATSNSGHVDLIRGSLLGIDLVFYQFNSGGETQTRTKISIQSLFSFEFLFMFAFLSILPKSVTMHLVLLCYQSAK